MVQLPDDPFALKIMLKEKDERLKEKDERLKVLERERETLKRGLERERETLKQGLERERETLKQGLERERDTWHKREKDWEKIEAAHDMRMKSVNTENLRLKGK